MFYKYYDNKVRVSVQFWKQIYGVHITVYVVVVGHWTVAFSDESSEEGNGKSVDKCIQVDRTKSNLTSILKPSPGICMLGVRLAAPPHRMHVIVWPNPLQHADQYIILINYSNYRYLLCLTGEEKFLKMH